MALQLTSGSVVRILNGKTPDCPVFQLINARKIGSSTNSAVDRYRLIISDGEYMYSHVMLPAQHNHLIESGSMDNNAVIKVNKYLCNVVNGDRKVLILLDVTVLAKGSDVGSRLGDPAQLNPAEIPPLSEIKNGTTHTNASSRNESTNVAPQNQSVSNNNNFPSIKKSSTPGTPGSSRIHPIATLTPYQNRWRVRARVTNKSNIKTWNNSRGEGRLFSVNLIDESGEIRCTGFNEQVDKYYNMLELNKVYYFSKCTLKTANKQYSNLNADYEMNMNGETIIEPCNEANDLPSLTFDFVPLSKLNDVKPNTHADVIGVVKVVKELGSVLIRSSNKETQKRDIQIVDQSGMSVNITLWGDDAAKFEGDGYPIMALKGARVSDFGGRSLSIGSNTTVMINPDSKEAHMLRGWFENEGRNQEFSSFQSEGGSGGANMQTKWKTFMEAKSENLGQGDKPDYFTSKGTVVFLKRDNCMYQACPTKDCNKKVINLGNGLFRCEKCAREFPNYKWRMILSANIADHSDNQWITCFQESAEAMLGIKADELGALREEDEIKFDNVMQEALFKPYIFRLRAKMETYNDENRMKTVCMTAQPVVWSDYGNHLVDELEQMCL